MTLTPQLSLVTAPLTRFAECRRETRTVCKGEVHLLTEDESRTFIMGEVLDVSSSGFRASYREPSLATGTEVRFRHRFFQGRARVMWSSFILNTSQSGFLVVRDV